MRTAKRILLLGPLGGAGKTYDQYLLSLTPAAYWRLDEANGASTFADSSGNGLTATGAGSYISGVSSIVPAMSRKSCVHWTSLGQATLASSATFDYSALAPFSFVTDFGSPVGAFTGFLYSKSLAAGNGTGHYLLSFNSSGTQVFEFAAITDASNSRKWRWNAPIGGQHNMVVAWGGSAAVAPSVYIDNVLQSPAVTSVGTPANISNAAVFRLGGRSDGLFWPSLMQNAACFARALTATEIATLWSKRQIADRGAAVPYIYDTDGGSSDKGDLQGISYAIHKHLTGQINLLGVMITCGDAVTAPASRAILDYYGLTAIPVGAYQGSDIHVAGGAGTPSKLIRDQFRPGDTRANPIYLDPATFYSTVLAGQPDGSVVVEWGGFANSMATFINASGANQTLWNAKVKLVAGASGQWPNSSSSATPAGNFLAGGPGEWNLGGSGAGTGSEGPVEAQAAVDLIAKCTAALDWHGVEICGGTGNSPTLSTFIASGIPGWPTTNPISFGFTAGTTRASWDVMGTMAAYEIAVNGDNNLFWTRNQLATPAISTVTGSAGQNTSSAGSSNNFYLTPKLGSYTLAQWRALMANLCQALHPTT